MVVFKYGVFNRGFLDWIECELFLYFSVYGNILKREIKLL